MKTCSIEGCERKIASRGICKKHWNKHYRTGTLSLFPRQTTSAEEKLSDINKYVWENSEQIPWTGCWIWLKHYLTHGYAGNRVNNKNFRVSRLVLGIHNSSPDILALHKCDTPSCVNPDHLFIGSTQDNIDDMVQKGRHRTLRGEDSNLAVLTEKDILSIRKEYEKGDCNQGSLAIKYAVSRPTISLILSRKRWAHI